MSEHRPHISPSQIGTMLRCPEAWRRRYIEGEKIPPGFAAMVGHGVHEAAAANFQQKIASHQDMPPSQITEIAVAALDERVNDEGVTLNPDGGSFETEFGKAIDKTATLAMHHATVVAPAYQPTHVEEPFRIELPKLTHDLIGFVDMLTDQEKVVDFKTTGRKKKQAEADNSLQLTTYAIAAKQITGKIATDLVLDVQVHSEKGVEHDVLQTQRGHQDFAILANTVNAVVGVINSGNFPPAAPGSWYCSAKWCGFFNSCRFTKH